MRGVGGALNLNIGRGFQLQYPFRPGLLYSSGDHIMDDVFN
jgi:hypothetical protein